ncbi:hypothetical protein [Variovorax sp. 770b2]|uniref:hypothetical protein n=1 Tax=Variovorax sp. 770b2 TaxID=1566271 RepID=UPI0008E65A6B|nr:hypothetical protein [Variovorax sp. 770b2]SFQ40288.1 hypothetical protein SAMN03159339_0307 [Variovorax sp. 770b2]
MNQVRFIFTDELHAIAYWATEEFRKYAVDVRAGPARRPMTVRTLYVRARTPESAVECAKRADWLRKRGARYSARLAGPRELGCVATGHLQPRC